MNPSRPVKLTELPNITQSFKDAIIRVNARAEEILHQTERVLVSGGKKAHKLYCEILVKELETIEKVEETLSQVLSSMKTQRLKGYNNSKLSEDAAKNDDLLQKLALQTNDIPASELSLVNPTDGNYSRFINEINSFITYNNNSMNNPPSVDVPKHAGSISCGQEIFVNSPTTFIYHPDNGTNGIGYSFVILDASVKEQAELRLDTWVKGEFTEDSSVVLNRFAEVNAANFTGVVTHSYFAFTHTNKLLVYTKTKEEKVILDLRNLTKATKQKEYELPVSNQGKTRLLATDDMMCVISEQPPKIDIIHNPKQKASAASMVTLADAFICQKIILNENNKSMFVGLNNKNELVFLASGHDASKVVRKPTGLTDAITFVYVPKSTGNPKPVIHILSKPAADRLQVTSFTHETNNEVTKFADRTIPSTLQEIKENIKFGVVTDKGPQSPIFIIFFPSKNVLVFDTSKKDNEASPLLMLSNQAQTIIDINQIVSPHGNLEFLATVAPTPSESKAGQQSSVILRFKSGSDFVDEADEEEMEEN